MRLFAQELGAEPPATAAENDSEQDDDLPPGSGSGDQNQARPRGRRPLPAHLKRERIEHDLSDEEKHGACVLSEDGNKAAAARFSDDETWDSVNGG